MLLEDSEINLRYRGLRWQPWQLKWNQSLKKLVPLNIN